MDTPQQSGFPVSPESYPRRVLLAVTGLSPQIVTETLYALAVARDPKWVPTEIQVLTTVRGAENARLNLLSESPGWFHRICRDYSLPKIAFADSDIHILRRPDGAPLDDIRDEADNMAAADFITEHVRALTQDESASLHVSIAGGRKTMGFFLGYALSLFGRQQDRLSHVLVAAPFESQHEFYYPTLETRVLQGPNKQTLDAKDARVWLGDIPFVRLRDGLPEALLSGASRFSDSVLAAQRALAEPSLVVELSGGGAAIRAGDTLVELAPADAAFYLLMVRAAEDGRTWRWDDAALQQAYLREYARFAGDSVRYDEAKRRLAEAEKAVGGEDLSQWFEERKAKCNAALRRALGKARAHAYEIQGVGEKGRRRFRLALGSERVHVLEDLPGTAASLPARPRRDRAR